MQICTALSTGNRLLLWKTFSPQVLTPAYRCVNMHAYMQKRSALRRMVDLELEVTGNPDLAEYIAAKRAAGHTVEEALTALREVTGVPVALRTLWAWLKADEESVAS